MSNGRNVTVEEACIAAHNKARTRHNETEGLTWDSTLAEEAQDWANQLADLGGMTLQHGAYGENLYASASTASSFLATPAQATYSWCVVYINVYASEINNDKELFITCR